MVALGLFPRLPGTKGTSEKPIFLEFRSSKAFIMFVVVFAVFTDIFLYGVIVPVAPTALIERVGLPPDDEQKWTSILLALYGAALLATAPISGYLADRVESRRWPMLIGLIGLVAATALLCVGTSLGLWIAGRIFQGISAAVVWTVGLALLVDTIGKDGIGQAMGYAGMAITFGTLTGPLLGGVIYGKGGYYAVFGLSFGLIGIDIVLRFVMIEQKYAVYWLEPEPAPSAEQTHEKSSLTETAANTPGSDTSQANDQGDTPAEKKQNWGPLYTLLSSERILVTIWAYFILSLILTSFDSVLPIFVQDTFRWKQTAQGLIFLPLEIPHLLDPLIGMIIDRHPSARRYLAAGGFFCAVPVIVVLRLVTENSMSDKILLCAMLALAGCCIAAGIIPLMVEVTYAVMAKEEKSPDTFGKGGAMALAYGVLNSAYAAGSVVGPFFAGFIRNSAGWGTMTWALALITGVSGVPLLLFVGGFILRKSKSRGALSEEGQLS